MKVLVVNAGSSSIKYQVFDMTDESVLAKGLVDRVGIPGTTLEHKPAGKDEVVIKRDLPDHTEGMKLVLDVLVNPEYGCIKSMDEIGAVGHRVVHGGEDFSASVVIDDNVKKVIKDCFDIAPLHNPPNLMGIEACQALMPNVPHVAVFDTAFHQTMEPANFLYALPYEVYEKHKVRRYGFHGTSHFYVSQRAAEMLGKPYEECKIITLHMGNGASMAAIKNGKVVDTSMGFTPLEGLVMGTRSGDIDPAIVFFLMEKLGLSAQEANNYFNKKSGMLGLSGVSNDLRDILEAASSGNERAQIALEVYYNRVKGYIGKYVAKLNGCDCLVFTAGVGENGYDVREKVCEDLDYLGIKMDVEKNKVRGKEVDVAAEDSKVRIFVIPTNEELVIARDTYNLAK
ncbi:MAG: acetate/propionate family kinase [Syntrophomonadaceae bacterium]|jgi:acetate kinase|nr:acetate kinase [Bacillota bacterium]NLM88441.1 acetate kinase [Syntrophomonadaceae bacterium]HQA50855.1 acetate kinase [Syntrophomonadaceae bacterium]HQD90573.1 acetate kinase [Syntrophomonadaceae bacterium]